MRSLILRITIMAAGLNALTALGQPNSFTYQGQLKDDGVPANGSYNLVFKLFDGDNDQVGPSITRNGVVLTNGLFNQVLDFGAEPFTGGPLWLQITANGVVLTPKQPLTATPYALYALNAPIGASPWVTIGNDVYNANGNLGNVSIGGLTPTHSLTISAADQETMRLFRSTTNYGEGARLNFGDEDYAFIEEDVDDALLIQANRIALSGGEVRLPGGANPANYNTHFNYSGDGRNYIRGATIIADTGGNVGIGTTNPLFPLTVYSDIGYGLVHTDGTHEVGSYVDAAGGWLGTRSNHPLHFFTDNSFARLTLTTAGNLGIGTTNPASKLHINGDATLAGNAIQARDKGGFVKAMAKVNADGSIARQYSALGGTITAQYDFSYRLTFPFQVNDRFLSVTPHYNLSVGQVAATIYFLSGIGPNEVMVFINDLDNPGFLIANEFFIFVY